MGDLVMMVLLAVYDLANTPRAPCTFHFQEKLLSLANNSAEGNVLIAMGSIGSKVV